jgi:hypothetical protein
MKRLVAISILFVIFFVFDAGFAYEEVNVLQFPLESYSAGANKCGTFNLVVRNKYHLGEDASASAGTEVYAVGNGKIMRARIQTGYGGIYIIEHSLPNGEKFCSLYAHLNFASFTKSEGDEVGAGKYLGKIGTTSQNGGWSEHLHFGIYKGEYPNEPDEYICGDWIFSGYNACQSVLNNWCKPTSFIKSFQSPYRLVGNVAWYPPNKSCICAEKWIYYNCGYPNGGMSVSNNQICYDKEYEMIQALGGLSSNWSNIIFGIFDLNEIGICEY